MVYHVLRDGSRTNDITGHIVKFEDAKGVYLLIESINKSVPPDRRSKREK